MIRIAIVEDDTGYRSQLGKYIDQYQSDFSETVSVSEFSDGLEIVEKYKSEYDIILMDIQMKHMDGMQAAMRIRDIDKNVIIIFITNSGGLYMRVVVQRVKHASVTINGTVNGKINNGFLVLLGIQSTDSEQDVDYLVKKVTNLRIFSDENDKMNLSLKDVNGELLIVSQFTLYANCKEGNRPSFVEAAKPDIAIPLYEYFVSECKKIIPVVETGIFGADMKVDLLNDGPVTIIMDSK